MVLGEEALELFRSRDGFNFSWGLICSDDVSLLELSRAAAAVGRTDLADTLFEQALAAGSGEARATLADQAGRG